MEHVEREVAQPGEGSLRVAAASGAKWTALSSVTLIGTQTLQMVVLARLLHPRELGLAALVQVVIAIGTAFADMGFSEAVIARQTTDRGILSSLYWVNILTGLLIAGAILAAIPLIVAFYGQPRLEGLLPLGAAIFVVAPFGQQFRMLLQKDLQFSTLTRIEIASMVIGAGTAVGAAFAGVGAASLLLGALATATIRAALLTRWGWKSWRPSLRLRRADLHGYLGFGMYLMGNRLMNFLSANVDYIVVGRFLGPSTLGAYTLAYQLVVRPQVMINPIFTRVAFPIFARRQTDDAALRRGFLELTRVVALTSFPLLAGLAILAPTLVPVVFGPGWESTATFVQILALVGAFKALANPTGPVAMAKNRPDLAFWVNVGILVSFTIAFTIGVQGGAVAFAWVYVVAQLAALIVSRLLLKYLIGLSLRQYWSTLRRPAEFTAIMSALVVLTTLAASSLSMPDVARLAISIAVGGLTYATVLWLRERRYVADVWGLLRGR